MAPSTNDTKPTKPAPPKKLAEYAPSDRKILIFSQPPSSVPKDAVDVAVDIVLFPLTVYATLFSKLLGLNSSRPSLPPGSLVVATPSAAAGFKFPPGHPVMKAAYVLHPLSKDRYIPAASFHRALFEEKVSELITLLAALGATRVRVIARQGYNSLGGIKIGISTPKGDLQAGEKNWNKNTSYAVFEERFTSKTSAKVPSKLMWFEHEPTWKHIAERRRKYKTLTFQAELRYEDSYGVDRNLKAGLKGLGIEFGNDFTDFQTTVWEFEGEFSELKQDDCSLM